MKRRWEGPEIDQYVSALESKKTDILIRHFDNSEFFPLEDYEDISEDTILYLIEKESFSKYQENICSILFKNSFEILKSIVTNQNYTFERKWTIAERGLRFKFLKIVQSFLDTTYGLVVVNAFILFFKHRYDETIEHIIDNPNFASFLAKNLRYLYIADALTNQNIPIFNRPNIPKFSSLGEEDRLCVAKFLLTQEEFNPKIHRDDFLMDAVLQGDTTFVERLLSYSSIIDALKLDCSPIYKAIQMGDMELVNCFVDCKALQISSIGFNEIFDYAKRCEQIECLSLFLDLPFYRESFIRMHLSEILKYPKEILNMVSEDLILHPDWKDSEEYFQIAIEKNLDFIVKDRLSSSLSFNRYNLLFNACKYGCNDIVNLLLEENNPELESILKCETEKNAKQTENLWLVGKKYLPIISVLVRHEKMKKSRDLNHPKLLLKRGLSYPTQKYLFDNANMSLDSEEKLSFIIKFEKPEKIKDSIQRADPISAENFGRLLFKNYLDIAQKILEEKKLQSYSTATRITILCFSFSSIGAFHLVKNDNNLKLSSEEFRIFLEANLSWILEKSSGFISIFLNELILKILKQGMTHPYFRPVVDSMLESFNTYMRLICKANHRKLIEFIVNLADVIYYSSKNTSWLNTPLTIAAKKSSAEIIGIIFRSSLAFSTRQYTLVIEELLQYANHGEVIYVLDEIPWKELIAKNINNFLPICIKADEDSLLKFCMLVRRSSCKPDGVQILKKAVESTNEAIRDWIMENKELFDWKNFFRPHTREFNEESQTITIRYDLNFDLTLIDADSNLSLYYLECLIDPIVISQLKNHSDLQENKHFIMEAISKGYISLVHHQNSSLHNEGLRLSRNQCVNLHMFYCISLNPTFNDQIFAILHCLPENYNSAKDNSSIIFKLFLELYLYFQTNKPIPSMQEIFEKIDIQYSAKDDLCNLKFPLSEKETVNLAKLILQDESCRKFFELGKLRQWVVNTFIQENSQAQLLEMIFKLEPQNLLSNASYG